MRLVLWLCVALLCQIVVAEILDHSEHRDGLKTDCPVQCRCFSSGDAITVNHVDCDSAALTHIPRGIPSTVTSLNLRRNFITRIDASALAHLQSLHTLFLSDNLIQHLNEDFLDVLPSLRRLHLSRNKLRELPRLSSVDGLVQLHSIDIHANLLRHIARDAFDNLWQLSHVNLAHNFLQTVPKELFVMRLNSLHLEHNPWNCDCRIIPLLRFIKQDSTIETKNRHHHNHGSIDEHMFGKCRWPKSLRGEHLRDVALADAKCSPTSATPIESEGRQRLDCTALMDEVDSPRKLSADDVEWLYKSEPLFDSVSGELELMENGSLLMGHASLDISQVECARNYHIAAARYSRHVGKRFQNGNSNYDNHYYSTGSESHRTENNEDNNNNNLNFRIGPFQKNRNTSQQQKRLQQQQQKQSSIALSEAAFHTRNEAPSEDAAPRFTYVSRDRSFREGSAATLNCEVVGRPQPHIVWRFSSSRSEFASGSTRSARLIEPSRKFQLRRNNTELVIFPFLEFDVGRYTCEATNKHGSVSASSSVGILHARAPTIVEGPKTMRIHIGQRAVFHCRARGEPTPAITWFFDGSEIAVTQNNGHFKISSDGTELTLEAVTRHDKGTYSCMAGNSVGSMTADAQLHVETSQLDTLDARLSQQVLSGIVQEASQNIDRAIMETKNDLQRTNISTPQELFRHFKFTSKRPVELTKAREIYEESLRLIQKHVEQGLRLRPTDLPTNASYESVLSVTHIQTIMELSGCMNGQFRESCNDMCFHSKYRTYTGQCNNFEHPTWGVSQMPFYRLLPPIYENGFNTPVGLDPYRLYFGFPKPNPRTVSMELIQTREITPHHRLSAMVMQWGQFVDHDMDFTATALARQTYAGGAICNRTCENVDPCFNIPLPLNDPRRVPDMKFPCIEFERSAAICGSGETSPIFHHIAYREQTNTITSFIDASNVYGSTEVDAVDLRDLYGDHGLLRFDIVSASQKPYMPFEKDSTMDCRRNRSVDNPIRCFLSGDVRANEQLGLTAIHTIWFREHNRIAARLLENNANWDGEHIYQEARKIVGAMLQHITFEHWLPKIIGQEGYDNLIGPYTGYDPLVNPSVSNAFATAAFRFGHTIINPKLERLDQNFESIAAGPLMLHDAFFVPERLLSEGGIDPLIRGLFGSPLKAPKSGQLLNAELTEKLFHRAHDVSLDLAVMNIQRGRDHGLPGYLEYRRFCNLTVPDTWEALAPDVGDDVVLEKLKRLYGHPGNIDLFVGGIVERRLADALVGPTFSCIIADQFRRVRAGDRFWYENPSVFTPLQLNQLRKASLAKTVCNNGDAIDRVQPDVFLHVGDGIGNTASKKLRYRKCDELPDVDLRMWMSCCESGCGGVSDDSEDADLSSPKRKRRAHHLYGEHLTTSNSAPRTVTLRVAENKLKAYAKPTEPFSATNNATTVSDEGYCTYSGGKRARDGARWTSGACSVCKCEEGSVWCTRLENCVAP